MSAPITPSKLWRRKPTKGLGGKEPNMLIIGCDYHPGFQQIALVDTDRGELSERRLLHREKRSSLSQAAGARAEGACRDGALSLRKATGQLRRAGSDGRVQRRSSPAGPHQQARQRAAAVSAGGSGAGHDAQSTGVAQQVLSPGHAAWTEDCESSDGAETGGAPVLDVAPGLRLRPKQKLGSHAGE